MDATGGWKKKEQAAISELFYSRIVALIGVVVARWGALSAAKIPN